MNIRNKIFCGDSLDVLKTLPDECIHMCVTSPPYWGLRTYHVDNQIGIEETPDQYVKHLVDVFHEVKRILRKDGTLWLNLGDCYSPQSSHKGGTPYDGINDCENWEERSLARDNIPSYGKPKDLMGMPWRVAFALQNDGWYLRKDIIWAKSVSFCPTYSGQCMPEPVKDRPTASHEYVFLFTKRERYFYDQLAVQEKSKYPNDDRGSRNDARRDVPLANCIYSTHGITGDSRNLRSVWTINPQPFTMTLNGNSHFATFPEDLIKPMILIGTSEIGVCSVCGSPHIRVVEKGEALEEWKKKSGADSSGEYKGKSEKWLKQDALGKQTYTGFNDRWNEKQQNASDVKRRILAGMVEKKTVKWIPTCECNSEKTVPAIVLDVFMGAGTTALVSLKNSRDFVGIELNPEYIKIAEKRISKYRVKRLSEW